MGELLVANWKMNPLGEREAVKLAKAGDKKGVVICPPFVFLESVGKILKKAKLGAQDVFWKEKGAFTGEVSAKELKSLGVKYVILGHSERRALGEMDAMINKKVLAALRAGLKVILCVGENLTVRKRGIGAAKNFVKEQLRKDLKSLIPKSYVLTPRLMIAYEPVWAIGTGKNDSPEDAAEMIQFIRNFLKAASRKLKTKVLYGGSVNAGNIAEFAGQKKIDGFLVGGASLKIGEFSKIISKLK